MNIERKVNRNKIKKAHKNNKIREVWRFYQIEKYGIQEWCKMYNKSTNIKDRANKVTPENAHYI